MKNNTTQTYFERDILFQLKKWVDRREIFAIRGPRQSGKTTLLKIFKEWLIKEKGVKEENIIFLTFEDKEILNKFSLAPKEYVKSLIFNKEKERVYIFIDEFQYLKSGGQILKLLFDIFENVKFIITGSSSLELLSETAKFLVGRIFYFNLWQLSFSEFLKVSSPQLFVVYKENNRLLYNFIYKGENFLLPQKDIFSSDFEKEFQKYITYGSYPAVVSAPDYDTKKIILKNIYNTYILRDILGLLQIKDYNKLESLVALLSAQIGNIINYNSLAQDIKSYFKEIKKDLNILSETFIISLLPPYFSNKTSELKKNPKIYFVDMGLRNYVIGNMEIDNLFLRPDIGAMAENFIFSQLLFKKNNNYAIKYWRTSSGAEIDFIIENGNELVPIEIKFSSLSKTKVSRGFYSFLSTYKPKRAIILTRGFWGEKKINNTLLKFIPLWYI